MIVYKGFGHGISKPKAMRAVMNHNLGWFNHYLWNDPLPDFSVRLCQRRKAKTRRRRRPITSLNRQTVGTSYSTSEAFDVLIRLSIGTAAIEGASLPSTAMLAPGWAKR